MLHLPGRYDSEVSWLARAEDGGEKPQSLENKPVKRVLGQLGADFMIGPPGAANSPWHGVPPHRLLAESQLERQMAIRVELGIREEENKMHVDTGKGSARLEGAGAQKCVRLRQQGQPAARVGSSRT